MQFQSASEVLGSCCTDQPLKRLLSKLQQPVPGFLQVCFTTVRNMLLCQAVIVLLCHKLAHSHRRDALVRSDWHRRRATEDDIGWRGRATDDSSISGASRREPCPLALCFSEACIDQVRPLPLGDGLSDTIVCISCACHAPVRIS